MLLGKPEVFGKKQQLASGTQSGYLGVEQLNSLVMLPTRR